MCKSDGNIIVQNRAVKDFEIGNRTSNYTTMAKVNQDRALCEPFEYHPTSMCSNKILLTEDKQIIGAHGRSLAGTKLLFQTISSHDGM